VQRGQIVFNFYVVLFPHTYETDTVTVSSLAQVIFACDSSMTSAVV